MGRDCRAPRAGGKSIFLGSGGLDTIRSFVGQADQGYAQSATTLIIFLDAKRTYFDTLSDYYEALGKGAANDDRWA